MSFDYYAEIGEAETCPKPCSDSNLSPCFSYGCTVACYGEHKDVKCSVKSPSKDLNAKNEARQCYMKRVKKVSEEKKLQFRVLDQSIFEPTFDNLPFKNAIGIEVHFKLKTPWYSKDDRLFHVLDNPVRKDWVFGMPFIPASDWKGMLRWACRMACNTEGEPKFRDYLDKKTGWKDPQWIIHLFGNEKDEKDNFLQGALRFFPTFFDQVSFEVINPHNRATKAGTQPIYYEVVPAGTDGVLRLLYAPARPGTTLDALEMAEFGKRQVCLDKLVDAIESLLTKYGISAKRTVGWGACKICKWCVMVSDFKECQDAITTISACKNEIYSLHSAIIAEEENITSETIPGNTKISGYLLPVKIST